VTQAAGLESACPHRGQACLPSEPSSPSEKGIGHIKANYLGIETVRRFNFSEIWRAEVQGPIAALHYDLTPSRFSCQISERKADRWLCYAWPSKLTLAAAASTAVRQPNMGARSNLRAVFRQALHTSRDMALLDMVVIQRLVTRLV
jgi:hypothetical protein